MWCMKCNNDLMECVCPDIEERLATLSGPGGPLVSRWCVACNKHYAGCKCENPVWGVRQDGKLK